MKLVNLKFNFNTDRHYVRFIVIWGKKNKHVFFFILQNKSYHCEVKCPGGAAVGCILPFDSRCLKHTDHNAKLDISLNSF